MALHTSNAKAMALILIPAFIFLSAHHSDALAEKNQNRVLLQIGEGANVFGLEGIEATAANTFFNWGLKTVAKVAAGMMLSVQQGGTGSAFDTAQFMRNMRRTQAILEFKRIKEERAAAFSESNANLSEVDCSYFFEGIEEWNDTSQDIENPCKGLPLNGTLDRKPHTEKNADAKREEIEDEPFEAPKVCNTFTSRACKEAHQVSMLGANNECECADALNVEFVFPDLSLDSFDEKSFLGIVANTLGLPPGLFELIDLRAGSVIATVRILPDPNQYVSDMKKIRILDNGKPSIPAGYSNGTLSSLESLLSSHYLSHFGSFEYEVSTNSKMCQMFSKTKEETREMIKRSSCNSTNTVCNIIWGKEYGYRKGGNRQSFNQDFAGGLSETMKVIRDSVAATVENTSSLLPVTWAPADSEEEMQKVASLLSEVGRSTNILVAPSMHVDIEGGIANFSEKNCTGCACLSVQASNQPYLTWKLM